ncbi:hypothetical protein RKD27_005239 [Streptomyces sp. SAI-126]
MRLGVRAGEAGGRACSGVESPDVRGLLGVELPGCRGMFGVQPPDGRGLLSVELPGGRGMFGVQPPDGRGLLSVELPGCRGMFGVQPPDGRGWLSVELPGCRGMFGVQPPDGRGWLSVELPGGRGLLSVQPPDGRGMFGVQSPGTEACSARNCRAAGACSAFNYPAPCGQWGRRRFPNPPRTGRVGSAGTVRVARGVVSGAGVSRVFLCGSVRRESEGLVMSRASICDQPLHS